MRTPADMLRGYTLPAAKEEAARMTRRAEEIAAHLARYHYLPGNMVRQNLETEQRHCETEAHDLQTRIADVEAMQHARGVA